LRQQGRLGEFEAPVWPGGGKPIVLVLELHRVVAAGVLSDDGDRAGFEAGLGNGVRKLLRHAGKVAARNLEICEELFEPAYLVDSGLC
jgi:hypothetical protein